MRGLLNEVCCGLDILKAHVLGTRHVYQHAVRAVYRGLHERAGDRHLRGLLGLALADSVAHAHVREARVLHDGRHVREVEVYKARVLDKVGDAGDGLTQHVVGDLEGVGQRDLLVGSVFQAVIRDYEQGIDLAEQGVDASERLVHPALALELEGLGHDADGQRAGLSCDLSHGGSRAGARAAAHTGGDEHHVCVLERLCYVVPALLSAALADVRVGARALAMGQLLADLDFLVRARDRESLLVRVHGNELNALRARLHHAVHNVVAGSADTNDLQRYDILGAGFGFIRHIRCLPVIF